jgi:hypothetical protein
MSSWWHRSVDMLESITNTWSSRMEPEVKGMVATKALSAPNQQRSVDSASDDANTEIFTIMDESGVGWGFDLDPATVARPLAIASGVLFSLGMLAGIPAGLALGRTEESTTSVGTGCKPVRPTAGGAWMAFRAFACGTLLCGACGAAATYATAYYYDAWTWDEFGRVMRDVIPGKRDRIESTITPWLDPVRSGAAEGLPGPVSRARDRFGESRIGIYLRTQIEQAAANVVDDEVVDEQRSQNHDLELESLSPRGEDQ